MTGTGRKVLLAAALILLGLGAAVWWQFTTDIAAAKARVAQGSTLIDTPCGRIEYQAAGEGPVLLAVHGSGGGFDQGMAFAAPLIAQGIRVVAMSRFGYLRTPMPPDGSAEAQADAFVCLLDGLGIDRAAVMGGSAGALSALQMAIRHPERVSALILLVPLGYRPPGAAPSAPPMTAWVEAAMMRVIGSDVLFWAGLHVARDRMIATVVATPPAVVVAASPAERARVNAMLDAILPVSARAAGLRADTAAGKAMAPAELTCVTAPTLIVSARDDGFGTYASAEYMAGQIRGARFLGFQTGGHAWVGHNDAVMAAIAGLVLSTQAAPTP
ncbi:alpha/beta hydrolase [Rhodobacter sp. Har01]|uniref:alpha/beta fold hydrolase n=1 Tax=Rhodobacter sp. Har01 TaxID=2883999 RepID=UPI001D06EFA9|nr:alpha/beta hydrolase [Rhodobacter sp. Har01]MCB6180134.1 alpha/beta hydrolase [Rhodobacter sp. Har01]